MKRLKTLLTRREGNEGATVIECLIGLTIMASVCAGAMLTFTST